MVSLSQTIPARDVADLDGKLVTFFQWRSE